MIEINWKPSRFELRMFGGLWLPLFLTFIGGSLLWRQGLAGLNVAGGLWLAAAVCSAIGWLAPAVMRPLFIALTVITFPIGWVVSHLLLGLIYYGVLTPIGLLMKLVGRDPMTRKFDRAATTYWTPHKPPRSKRQYFRQY